MDNKIGYAGIRLLSLVLETRVLISNHARRKKVIVEKSLESGSKINESSFINFSFHIPGVSFILISVLPVRSKKVFTYF